MATTDDRARDDRARAPRSEEFAYAIAGLIDLTASRVTGVIRQAQGVFRRSDLGLLAGEGRADLQSRGELAFRRGSHQPQAHMETLARRVVEQRGPHAGG
jgi:hypothetical protein